VTTILDFIRHTIAMATFVQAYLSQPARTLSYNPSIEPVVSMIVEPFFSFTIMFVVLVMLFSLAIRKAKGLWLNPHPEWAYPTVTYVHTTHYPQGPVPVGMMPGQPQYMQQQPMQGVPAYLQVAQQQQQQGQGQQGYYYYPQPAQQQPQQMQQPQQPQQPQPVHQQQTQEQPKTTDNV
jgi:hypothetical protein